MKLYRNTNIKVLSPDEDTDFFDIVAGDLKGDSFAPYQFIICLVLVLRTSIYLIKENGFTLKKNARSWRYPIEIIIDADSADNIALLANTPTKA